MTRGIKNVSGVSCHISCALQIVVHTLAPLSKALKKSDCNDPHPTRILSQLSDLVTALQDDDEGDPSVSATKLYKSLKSFSSSSSTSILALDPEDVGDASTAVSILLKIISLQSPDWAKLIDLCVGGRMSHSITGVCTKYPSRIERTKPGKSKHMPCPFPLTGRCDSLQGSIFDLVKSQTISGYSWKKANSESYTEKIFDEKVQTRPETKETKMSNQNHSWKTTKTLYLESLPNFCFFHLERFSYDLNGDKTIVNPSVDIPLTINIAKKSNLSEVESFKLLGGIMHVSEYGNIAEEGHYTTLLRKSNNDGPASWVLVDDESTLVIDSNNTALGLLKGTNEDGKFICGTLVSYGRSSSLKDEKHEELTKLVEILEFQGSQDLIGRRLRVKWARMKFYEGVVQSYDSSTRKHTVLYDDGDKKEYTLSQKTIEWI
jgi:uncharacterized UBP type Zn finger protein